MSSNVPPQRLLVVSHATHYRDGNRFHAYGPYSREIDIWADLFADVRIAAPCRDEAPPSDCLPFTRANISVSRVTETGGETVWAKLHNFVVLPRLVWQLTRAILSADAVHVRCPGNVSLLALMIAPVLRRRIVAKHAGQWNGYVGEPWTGRLQRILLRSWWTGPVTVYGSWPDQPPHIVPFFTSMMSDEQVRKAVQVADAKVPGSPLRVLFSGRLAAEKRIPALLDAVKRARDRGVELDVAILGEGSERDALVARTRELGIVNDVRFVGGLPFEQALDWYAWADCLVLPSVHSEGWPKVVAEAMCHGVLCIAVDHGQISTMLTDRGILLTHGSSDEIADAIESVARDPERYREVRNRASLWARQHSLESLRDAIADLLSRRWNTRVGPTKPMLRDASPLSRESTHGALGGVSGPGS